MNNKVNLTGWANHETELVNAWIKNDIAFSHYLTSIVSNNQSASSKAFSLERMMRELLDDDDFQEQVKTDLHCAAINNIKWEEIIQHNI